MLLDIGYPVSKLHTNCNTNNGHDHVKEDDDDDWQMRPPVGNIAK